MTHYKPQPVLPEYTDEALAAGTGYGRAEADKLLTIPPEYRQAAEAEGVRRSSRFDWSSGLVVSTGDACQVRTEVVAEIAAQLRAEAPDA